MKRSQLWIGLFGVWLWLCPSALPAQTPALDLVPEDAAFARLTSNGPVCHFIVVDSPTPTRQRFAIE